MRRSNFLIIIVLLITLFSFSLVSAANRPDITVNLISQSPDPVEPGQELIVKFKVENNGTQTTDDVILRFLPRFPFELYGDVAEKNLGKMRGGQNGADAEIVEYHLKVAPNAIEQNTELELELQRGTSIIKYVNNDFLIDIRTRDTALAISQVSSEPEQIAPGEYSDVSIMFKNTADSLIKDITFKLDFSATDLPLAPYQSSSEKTLGKLEAGYQDTLTYKIIAEPEATPGLYKVPLTITYSDDRGTQTTVSEVLAVTIGDVPQLKLFIKQSTVLQANKEGIVTIGLANSGTTNLKFVEIELLPSEDYQLVSTTNYFYLGDLDSDDTESEDVDLFINRGLETLIIPIKLKYRDANNKLFQQQFDLELNLYSASQLKRFGIIQTNNSWVFLILIILAIGGYVYYRRRKKKTKK